MIDEIELSCNNFKEIFLHKRKIIYCTIFYILTLLCCSTGIVIWALSYKNKRKSSLTVFYTLMSIELIVAFVFIFGIFIYNKNIKKLLENYKVVSESICNKYNH